VGAGLCSVAVAREHGDTEASVCGYLVDTFCLGVKNAIPASTVSRHELADFVDDFYRAYPSPPVPAPIELVHDLVFGSVEYARGLGFDPHPDFYLAAPHLGRWQPPGRITFGVGAGRCTSTARTTTRPASCASSTGRWARATTT
jgi:hypothetical protein